MAGRDNIKLYEYTPEGKYVLTYDTMQQATVTHFPSDKGKRPIVNKTYRGCRWGLLPNGNYISDKRVGRDYIKEVHRILHDPFTTHEDIKEDPIEVLNRKDEVVAVFTNSTLLRRCMPLVTSQRLHRGLKSEKVLRDFPFRFRYKNRPILDKQMGQVKFFMTTYGQDINIEETFPTPTQVDLRAKLLLEEAEEFDSAVFAQDEVEIADAIIDMLYIHLGTCITYGVVPKTIFKHDHVENIDVYSTLESFISHLVDAENKEEAENWINKITNILYTLALDYYGDEFELLFDEVHNSNMSKVCKNLKEVESTLNLYSEKGYTLLTVEEATYGGHIVKTKEGKVLKSTGYTPVNLELILDKIKEV